MKAGRTWIDVTDLVAWEGPPTGIPRVALNLAKRYASLPGVGFFVFLDSLRAFQEVAGHDVFSRVADQAPPRAVSAVGPAPSSNNVDFDRVLRYLRRLPPPLKRLLRQARSTGRSARLASRHRLREPVRRTKSAFSLARALAPSIQDGRLASTYRSRRVTFMPGDRVIVLGSGWSTHYLQTALAQEKSKTGVRVFQVVYDLAPIFQPQTFGKGFSDAFARYLFEAVSASDGMVAISEHSRSTLLQFCDELLLPRPATAVFRLGDEVSKGPLNVEPIPSLVAMDFILSVGTIEARKNHVLLYQSWKLAASRNLKLPKLVVVGRPGWAANDTLNLITNDPEVREAILVLNAVSDAQLNWLYSNCLFTIYPSVYEGWGLPIAESLARGKFCIASRTSAMPEVAGDLIEYFSPYSASECLDAIRACLDEKVLQAKEREIRDRYVVTTWDESFEHLQAAVEQLASG